MVKYENQKKEMGRARAICMRLFCEKSRGAYGTVEKSICKRTADIP